jgi:hypothetical protein
MERFVEELPTINAPDAERRLLPLLNPIMAAQGFDVAQQLGPNGGFDYVGTAAPDSAQQGRIGVEYKHLRQPVGVKEIDRIIGLVTGPRELVHGERESFIGGYRWQRSGPGGW